jgi:putative transposase
MEHGLGKDKLALLRKLEKENATLKQLLAEKELESKLKDELLKKKYPNLKRWR